MKFFDVDWRLEKEKAGPVAVLNCKGEMYPGVMIVPVVFITNRSLERTSLEDCPQLAKNIVALISTTQKVNDLPDFFEIQLDCDWSESTKEKYFNLIHQIKKNFNRDDLIISSTIRLHQVKYFEITGVPPVDKGMLMLYNMGKVSELNAQNSILDIVELEKYLVNFDKYPLPLDVALPVFSWGALFRDGKLVRLINELSFDRIKSDTSFVFLKDNLFRLKHNKFLQGDYLYKNDLIRIESSRIETVMEAAKQIRPLLNNCQTVSLYHLNPTLHENYEIQELNAIYRLFE